LTPSLSGDVLADALSGLRHISGGLAPVSVWRVEDLDLC
jgi:homoserine dehydrogenase